LATRVFELARELDVPSKVILTKCRAEGLDIKNHMTTLTAGLEATIREWFTEGESTTAVETAEHVDLDLAHKQAKKERRRRRSEPEAEKVGEEAAEAETSVEEELVSDLPSAEEALGEETELVEEPAGEEVEQEAAEAAETPAEAVAVAEASPADVSASAETETPPSTEPAVAEAASAQAQEQPSQAPPATTPPQAGAKSKEKAKGKPRDTIKPAGPQLVPRPATLKGPRVVRVERADHVPLPRRSAPPPAGMPGPTSVGRRKPGSGVPTTTVEEEEAKKGKRRSPRRKGGRSADSGEKLVEWRDRDLLERSQRLAAASGGSLRRHRASVGRKGGEMPSAIKGDSLEIEEPITVKSLSAASGLKISDIIRKLMQEGIMATANQVIDREQAEAVLIDYNVDLVVKRPKTAKEELVEKFEALAGEATSPRAPVVTFMGHVDHGKTSLLDHIRQTAVAAGEAGGITQHIGSYRYDVGDRHVVFLDTPGHEAFTAMRSRGANMTDVVVLVVAADDGVMPQTVEAISHAKAAKVPIIVALNKTDVPNANVQRVLGQLAEHGLNPREWGGDTEVIQTSAVTGAGMDRLVETLSLEAELLELKADPGAPASGYVIESEIDPGRGPVARLLVKNGTLHIGNVLLAGRGFGRVRDMIDAFGRGLDEAGPSTPIEVSGLDELPEAGDKFYVAESIDQARQIAEERREQARVASAAPARATTLESLFSRMDAGGVKQVALIIKADVQGSLEAITGSLNKLSTDEVKVNILHTAVGGISTSDIALAEASKALVLGFNVVADSGARQLAEEKGVEVRSYRIIYEMIDDVRNVLEKGLAPEIRTQRLGQAEVRQVFKISRLGTVAGCYVTEGLVRRNAKLRLIRNNVVVEDDRQLESLKRVKDDVREVRAGMECGLKIAGYDDVKEGDILEFYQQVEVARKL